MDNYFPENGNYSNIWCFAIRRWLIFFPENETIAIRRWLIIAQRTRPLHSDGGYLFLRGLELFKRMVFCNQMVAYYFPENETIAFRWWLIITQRIVAFQTYGTLQSKGGLLFPRVREFFKHMSLCSQKVAYYLPKNETFANRRRLIISKSTGTIQTFAALQSEGGLLIPRERDHCIQMVANYFSEYGHFSNIWCFTIRRWLIISQRTRPLQSDGS